MYLHITFADGSNPYYQLRKRSGELLKTRKDIYNALRPWKHHYNISGYWTSNGYIATAEEVPA